MKRSPLEEAQLKLGDRKWDSDYHFSHNEAKREFTTSTDSGERASDECLGDYDDDIDATILPPPFCSTKPASFSRWDFLSNSTALDNISQGSVECEHQGHTLSSYSEIPDYLFKPYPEHGVYFDRRSLNCDKNGFLFGEKFIDA